MKSIIRVTVPAESYDLTVLATVKAEMGITNNSSDDQLRVWIRQASNIAANYCNRVFAQETLTETFRPSAYETFGEALLLARRPIDSITSVTIDDEVLTSGEYEWDSEVGILYRLDTSGYRSFWYTAKSIIVVYIAGYELLDGLPYDIERAVIIMVQDFRSDVGRDPNLKMVRVDGIGERQWWVGPQDGPPISTEVSGLLERFRNQVIG